MLPSSRRACLPFLMGKAPQFSALPRDKPKSGAPTLKRFCPQGKQRRIRTPAAPPCPQGKAASFPRLSGRFFRARAEEEMQMRFYLYVLAQKKQAKQHREGRTSGRPAFSTLRGGFLLRRSKGRRAPKGPAAQRPSGPAGSAGSQCLRPHGDARPPHEQGAGALRFVSDGTAVGADGGRLTSRSLPPAKACVERRCLAPQGQGALQVCGGDAVCPCGAKALQSGAPGFGLSRERAESQGALPIRNGWQARRGTGNIRRGNARNTATALLR